MVTCVIILTIIHAWPSHNIVIVLLFPIVAHQSLQAEEENARQFLQTMGLSVARDVRNVPISLSYQEANELLKVFKKLDKDKDGHISTQDLRKALTEMGEKVTEDELRELISEVDINKNCTIEEEEFLKVCLYVCVCN